MMDAELRAVVKIERMLAQLPDHQSRRVLRIIVERLGDRECEAAGALPDGERTAAQAAMHLGGYPLGGYPLGTTAAAAR